jgi:hypothetical protein
MRPCPVHFRSIKSTIRTALFSALFCISADRVYGQTLTSAEIKQAIGKGGLRLNNNLFVARPQGSEFDWEGFLDRTERSFSVSTNQPLNDFFVKLGYLARLSKNAEGFYRSGLGGGIEKNPARIAAQIVSQERLPDVRAINCDAVNNFLLVPVVERLGLPSRKHEGLWTKPNNSGQHYIRTYESDGYHALVNYDEIVLLGRVDGDYHTRSLKIARAAQSTLGPAVGFYLGNQLLYTKNGSLLLDLLADKNNLTFASYGDGSQTFQAAHRTIRFARIITAEGDSETLAAQVVHKYGFEVHVGYHTMRSSSPYTFYRLPAATATNPKPSPFDIHEENTRRFETRGALLTADFKRQRQLGPQVRTSIHANGYAYGDFRNFRSIRDFDGRAPNYGTEIDWRTRFGNHAALDLYTPALLSASEGRVAAYYTFGPEEIEETTDAPNKNDRPNATMPQFDIRVGGIFGRPLSGDRPRFSPAFSGGVTLRRNAWQGRLEAQYLVGSQGTLLNGGSLQLTVSGKVARRTEVNGSFTLGEGAYANPLRLRNSTRPRFNEAGRFQLAVQQNF